MITRKLDSELAELVGDDQELADMAGLLSMAKAPMVEPDPAFRRNLRDRLVREGWRQQSPRRSWFSQLLAGRRLNWAAGTVGMLLIVTGLFTILTHNPLEVSSPLAGARQVAVIKPIELSFTQPMNRKATEQAIKIEPQTKVNYHWTSPTHLEIVPQIGSLAPGTEYHVTVAPQAQTASGKTLGKPSTVQFVTAEPNPTQKTPGGGRELPPAVSGLHSLGEVSDDNYAWAADGSRIYVIDPNGRLLAYPAAGGQPEVVAKSGVRAVATGSSGVAYVQRGDLVYGDGSVLHGVDPEAIGWQGANPIYLSGQDVMSQDRSIFTLPTMPSAASFSPNGNRLAYLTPEGLHLTNLANGSDRLLNNVGSLGAWSSDSSDYAYENNKQLFLADDTAPKKIADADDLEGLSWAGKQLLLARESGLYLMPIDGGTPTLISRAMGSYPLWSPTGNAFSYQEDGSVWVAQLTQGARPQSKQEDVVNNFMQARMNQDPIAAESFLKGDQSNILQLPLIYSGSQKLLRYDTKLDQPERMVLRLTITHDNEQKSVDETIVLHPDEQGRWWIWNVSDSPHIMSGGSEIPLAPPTAPSSAPGFFAPSTGPAPGLSHPQQVPSEVSPPVPAVAPAPTSTPAPFPSPAVSSGAPSSSSFRQFPSWWWPYR